jgi:hypothetical protein
MAEFEERDFAESDSRQYSASSERKSLMIGATGLLLVGLTIFLVWFVCGQFRHVEAIPQTRIIDVRLSGDWLTGEFRACQTDGLADVLFCPMRSNSQQAVESGRLEPRSFSVSFYGNISGKHEDTLNWNCKRETDLISCHAA